MRPYRPTEKQRPRGATGTRSPPENYGLSEKEIIPGKIGTQRDVNDYRMMIIISRSNFRLYRSGLSGDSASTLGPFL